MFFLILIEFKRSKRNCFFYCSISLLKQVKVVLVIPRRRAARESFVIMNTVLHVKVAQMVPFVIETKESPSTAKLTVMSP